MKRALAEKLRYEAYVRHRAEQSAPLPAPVDDGRKLVRVFVEGYEDVAFWRGIFDHFRNPYLRFEISVPIAKIFPRAKRCSCR